MRNYFLPNVKNRLIFFIVREILKKKRSAETKKKESFVIGDKCMSRICPTPFSWWTL